jgi:hypothetical protein
VLARRAGAIGGAVVVAAILFFGIRAYLASEETQALKNYNANVTSLLTGEQTGVEQPFFASLNNAPGTSGLALTSLQGAIYQDYVTANEDATTAAGWNVPSPMAGAQQDLLLALDLRAEAILKVSQQIEQALNTDKDSYITTIAGAMSMLAASDVIYSVRVQPLIEQALVDDGIQVADSASGGIGQSVYSGNFLPNQSWTIAGYVAGQILGQTPVQLGGSLGSGTHGHEILGVMAGATQLTPGQTINMVPYAKSLQFTVQFENDGTNEEFGVITKLTLDSASMTAPLVANATTRKTLPGQSYQSLLSFPQAPPLNATLSLTATVERVSGETSVANNTLRFLVDFTNS